jgi:hypothetical protein
MLRPSLRGLGGCQRNQAGAHLGAVARARMCGASRNGIRESVTLLPAYIAC